MIKSLENMIWGSDKGHWWDNCWNLSKVCRLVNGIGSVLISVLASLCSGYLSYDVGKLDEERIKFFALFLQLCCKVWNDFKMKDFSLKKNRSNRKYRCKIKDRILPQFMGQQEGKQIAEGFWKTETSQLRFETTDTGEWYSRQWRVGKTTTKKKAKSKAYIGYK